MTKILNLRDKEALLQAELNMLLLMTKLFVVEHFCDAYCEKIQVVV